VNIEKCTSEHPSKAGSVLRWSRRYAGWGILPATVAVLVMLDFVPQANARNADDSAAAQSYKSNCVVCHGADGTGTPTGKSLKAPDLHSDAVQKMTNQQIEDQIANGKNNMPPFKSTLSNDQIAALAAYVHSAFGKKK
jgi:mono/diheme cytochrome c family protein